MPDTWENQYDTKLSGIVNDASQDADNDGCSNLEEYTKGTDPTVEGCNPPVDDSITFSGSGGYKTVVTPIPNGVQGEMQVKQESDGSYRGSDGASSIVVTPDPAATGDTFTVTTGKNLTDNGEPLVFNATPNSDGSYTYSDPATPSVGVKVNENGSYTVTDTETPGTVLTGNPDGSQTVTDEESPGMTYKLDVGGSQIVTDEEFPGMTATLALDNNLTVKDNEFPGNGLYYR